MAVEGKPLPDSAQRHVRLLHRGIRRNNGFRAIVGERLVPGRVYFAAQRVEGERPA